MNEYETLWAELRRTFGTRKSVSLSASPFRLAAGLETLAPGAPYLLDGQKRGGDPSHPYLVFQVTLAGWGTFNNEKVMPGRAFAALVPSPHCYLLPPQSPGWTFFWLIWYHPYVVERVLARQQEMGAIVDILPTGGLLSRTAQITADVCAGGFRDRWAEEAALLGWLCEWERACDSMLYPAAPRETLLAEVRAAVLARLPSPPDVSELAWARGQSRSAFAHAFKAATGLAPAAFVTQVRLEQASRLLMDTHHTLEWVAAQTGFADANHFCKVFRRRFHLSPGAFRRQMK